jgi:integrase
VQRRLGLRRELDRSETFGEAWRAWLAGKRKARPSYARNLDQLGHHWLLPVLEDVALDRLNCEQSTAGERIVDLDKGSVAAGKAHRARRKRERLAAGEAWQESGRLFTRDDGSPIGPDWVSRRFKELAAAAGLPVIKFHGTRHTAASLALEAGLDIKIVSDQLGHSTTTITRDLYQNSQELHQAGEKPQASRSQDCRNGAPLVLMPAS